MSGFPPRLPSWRNPHRPFCLLLVPLPFRFTLMLICDGLSGLRCGYDFTITGIIESRNPPRMAGLVRPCHPRKETAAMHLRSIIIPAAGLGTRLLPATKVVPKELLNIYDRPVLQFAIDEAIACGVERIIVVIHPDKLAIRDYLKPADDYVSRLSACGKTMVSAALAAVHLPETIDLVFAFQNQPLGLGHAISCCKAQVLPGPVGVILPDDVIMGEPCLAQMAQGYVGGHMVAAMPVLPRDAQRYGIFRLLGTPTGRSVAASSMVEKPKPGTEPSLLAAVGRYILDPVIFSTLLGIPRGSGGEIQLTDAIAADAARVALTAFRFSGRRYDCGNHDGLLEAGIARQREVKRQRSLAVLRPGSVTLSAKINDCPANIRAIDGRGSIRAALEGTAS